MSPIKLALAAAGAAALLITACSSSPKSPTAATQAPPATSAPATSAPAATPPSATAAATSPLSGTWSGQYGGAYQGTFNLTWQQSGSKLNGRITISAPSDTLSINGTVDGNTIRFGTVGSMAITYSGTVSGSSMSGNYQVNGGNASSGGPWSATKAS